MNIYSKRRGSPTVTVDDLVTLANLRFYPTGGAKVRLLSVEMEGVHSLGSMNESF